MKYKFLTHHPHDNVGVAAVDIETNESVAGVCLETNKPVGQVKAVADVPLGHKIALGDLAKDTGIIKYGVRIGSAIKAIKAGEHVHVHNVKSDRW
jgi:(2R)-sulfolactate sulfo-lyase subunit alpha